MGDRQLISKRQAQRFHQPVPVKHGGTYWSERLRELDRQQENSAFPQGGLKVNTDPPPGKVWCKKHPRQFYDPSRFTECYLCHQERMEHHER